VFNPSPDRGECPTFCVGMSKKEPHVFNYRSKACFSEGL